MTKRRYLEFAFIPSKGLMGLCEEPHTIWRPVPLRVVVQAQKTHPSAKKALRERVEKKGVEVLND